MRFCAPLFLLAALASCGPSNSGGPVEVAIIGQGESLFQQGLRLSPAAQHLRAATNEGLVALDPAGQILPAVAERWIVTDDGLSYIFRLRNSDWPGGEPITANDARGMVLDNLRRLEGTTLGLDMSKVSAVYARTGRVVEITLSSPMPDFLRLLAQPEMGFVKSGSGAGPMALSRDDDEPLARLSALPPETRGLPAREDWEVLARPLTLRAMLGPQALDAFAKGEVDLVLNGRLSYLPLADTGPLSRGTIRLDAARGLLGLSFLDESGFLAEPANREALSMAIDRTALMQPFNIGGWQATTAIVPPEMWDNVVPEDVAWADRSIEARRAEAARRVTAWRAQSGESVRLQVGLPKGPGSDQLFSGIAQAWQAIGVEAVQVAPGPGADLQLYDRLARFASPRWFLNQFNCDIRNGPCSPAADALVAQSLTESDPDAKASLLAEAELALEDAAVFIPFGAPIRWSLVRSGVTGYEENPWGLHPLFPLTQPPI